MKIYLKGGSLYFKVSNVWVKTGIKVTPGGWNHKKQCVRGWVPLADELNDELASQKAQLTSTIRKIRNAGKKVSNTLIEQYREGTRAMADDEPGDVSLPALLRMYAQDHKATLKEKYTKRFESVAAHVEKFSQGISASKFSQSVLQEYLTHLLELEDGDGEAVMTNNGLHDHVRKIRRAMTYYGSQGFKVHKDCHRFKFRYIKPKSVWLDSEKELSLLEKFIPLAENQVYWEEFLFRCYTGLRFSDCNQLQPHHFIVEGNSIYLDFTAIKTRMDQNILLSSKAAAIVRKWNFRVPKLYNQDCNQRIKWICRAAKIKAPIEKVRFRGAERVVSVHEKWELVTTHVARRTFARAWLDRKGDEVKLMKYLGHSSVQQTFDYAGYETVEVNQELKRVFG